MLIYDVILDAGATGCQQTVYLYQGDDRSKMLRVTLLKNGRAYVVPSDLNVRLHAVKPDDSEISVKCGVRGGSVFYLPAANATDTQGTVRCQLQIRDHSGAVLFTPEFSVEVVETLPVPELPEGAAEDAEYNMEVLSELSASENGKTLLFRGGPVGTVYAAFELPESTEESPIEVNKVVYLIDEGFYRFEDDTWVQLTDDETIAAVRVLQQKAHEHTNQYTLDQITAQQMIDWDDAASKRHSHQNKATIDKLTESSGVLYFDGSRVGIDVVGRSEALPYTAPHGAVVYKEGGGLYVNSGTYQDPMWGMLTMPMSTYMEIYGAKHTHDNIAALDTIYTVDINRWNAAATNSHTHENKSTIDKFSQSDGKLLYDNDFSIPLVANDDVELLGLQEYTDLVIRDDVVTGETIQDVPVFLCTGVGDVCKLSDETVNVGDYIALSEVRQSDTGLPLRIIKTSFNGVYKVYCPYAFTSIASRPAGWSDENGDATSAPDFSGFTPDTITVRSTDYTSVDDLTDYARSALRSMSQCINVSADAMGTIVVPDDAVEQFVGTIEPNHKYYFTPGYDTTITLPSVGWSEGDAQFVMYLDCDYDYDFTFPSGTYFVGGEAPNTETGAHKLIGCWLKDKSKWAVGGMDYEVPT